MSYFCDDCDKVVLASHVCTGMTRKPKTPPPPPAKGRPLIDVLSEHGLLDDEEYYYDFTTD